MTQERRYRSFIEYVHYVNGPHNSPEVTPEERRFERDVCRRFGVTRLLRPWEHGVHCRLPRQSLQALREAIQLIRISLNRCILSVQRRRAR